MKLLTNPIKPYPWGSHTTIASLQRRSVPTDQPEAELWMGAHPAGPSLLADPGGPVPLTEATAELKLVPQEWYDTAKTFFG